jgi:hypothetical protein
VPADSFRFQKPTNAKPETVIANSMKTNNMKLGRLEKLDLRTYWKREATDYTDHTHLGQLMTYCSSTLID